MGLPPAGKGIGDGCVVTNWACRLLVVQTGPKGVEHNGRQGAGTVAEGGTILTRYSWAHLNAFHLL